MPRGPLPTQLNRQGKRGDSRNDVQLDHEVRRRHQEGLVRKHRPFGRNHHVPRYDVIIDCVCWFVRQK